MSTLLLAASANGDWTSVAIFASYLAFVVALVWITRRNNNSK
jgi:hypothetical protein